MRISGPIAAHALHNVYGTKMILFSDRHVVPKGLCEACTPPECMSIADFMVANIESSEAGGLRVLVLLETEGPTDDKVLKGWKNTHPYQLVKTMWALRPFFKGKKHLKRSKVLWTDIRKHPPAKFLTDLAHWLREILKHMYCKKMTYATLTLDTTAYYQFSDFSDLKKLKDYYDTLCFKGLQVSRRERKDKVRDAKYSKNAGMTVAIAYKSLNISQQHAIKNAYENRWKPLMSDASCTKWKETVELLLIGKQVQYHQIKHVTMVITDAGCVYMDIYVMILIMKYAQHFDVVLGYLGGYHCDMLVRYFTANGAKLVKHVKSKKHCLKI